MERKNKKYKYYEYNEYKPTLIYEGEYLNGKIWNAKGYISNYDDNNGNNGNNIKIDFELKEGKGLIKEYDNKDKLIFEGEYLNGQRNGKGKEYNYQGDLMFEGDYLNGLKWNGKVYDSNKEKNYELKEGKGYIKEYFDYIIFEGEFSNGKRNGHGKEYINEKGGLLFKGDIQMEKDMEKEKNMILKVI